MDDGVVKGGCVVGATLRTVIRFDNSMASPRMRLIMAIGLGRLTKLSRSPSEAR